MIVAQYNTALVDDKSQVASQWKSWFQGVTFTVNAMQLSGTTAQRPTGASTAGSSPVLWVGRVYFDTTLGKPVWVKTASPLVWVDATGTPA